MMAVLFDVSLYTTNTAFVTFIIMEDKDLISNFAEVDNSIYSKADSSSFLPNA